MTDRTDYALLLSGGGARAAYQVGVLKAITTFLPRNQQIPFPIICGNSAGAINAASLACYASCYHLGVRKLEWVWKNFRTHQVYQTEFTDTFGHLLRHYLRGLQTSDLPSRASSLLNNQPLRQLLRKTLNFSRLDRNILTGHLRAISVMTSSYSSHDSISFYQGASDIQPWQREKRRGSRCQLEVEHLMASAAIPVVFPCVRLNNEFLGDGSIHQLAPLSTPIHLGARKILIIGLEQPEPPRRFNDPTHFPNSASIAGHLLDSIFADTLNADLERLQRINQTIELLTPKQRKQTHLKPVECLVINPSRNFDALASRYYHLLPKSIRGLLGLIGVSANSDSSLLSYLLFEQEFCKELIHLGYQDGMARQEELREFLQI